MALNVLNEKVKKTTGWNTAAVVPDIMHLPLYPNYVFVMAA